MGDGVGNLVLDRECVLHPPFIGLRPYVRIIHHVDQLGRDPDFVPGLSDAPLEHIPDLEFFADCLEVHNLFLVNKGGCLGDDLQPTHMGQPPDQFFGNSVTKMLKLGIATHIRKRQYHDRGLPAGGGVGQTAGEVIGPDPEGQGNGHNDDPRDDGRPLSPRRQCNLF